MSGPKKLSKEERILQVLLGCVENYIETGKAVGSNTLKQAEFGAISSATIRNYYIQLEQKGYLTQQHTSGGRIPTDKAYRYYIEKNSSSPKKPLEPFLEDQGVEITSILQEAAEWLSKKTNTAVLLSSPRFDHDLIQNIRPCLIDSKRCLFVLITQFGQVWTEILPIDQKISPQTLAKIESYFNWRLNGSLEKNRPDLFNESALAENFYKEIMLRYIVRYTHFTAEEIFRCGFLNLLKSEDFKDPLLLASTLSLFETPKTMRHIIRETMKRNQLSVWIGKELSKMHGGCDEATLMAYPYRIGQKVVGAIALLGQKRSPYKQWMETLFPFAEGVSKVLTDTIYKHKISYRGPEEGDLYLPSQERLWLEDKRGN